MSTAIILKIGYNEFAIAAKPGVAGKLLELLQDAVPVRKTHLESPTFREVFHIEPRPVTVSVSVVQADQIRAPLAEDLNSRDAIDIRTLPGAVKLLRAAR